MKKLLIITILTAFTAGCEKEIPFEGEDARTRIVMHSFLSPNELIIVQLTESKSVLENQWSDYPPINGATVNMYADGVFVGTLQEDVVNQDGRYYHFDTPQAGVNYRFEVSHPEFESVSSSTKVPPVSPEFTAELIDTSDYYWVLEVSVKDTAPGPTFFLLDLAFTQWGTDYSRIYFESIDPFLKTPYAYTDPVDPYQYFDGEAYFTDDHFKNGTYTFRLEFYADYWYVQQFSHLDIQIKHMTEDYYLYLFSGQLQQWVEGDPFAQPAQVHNNVENGIGCVGSFNPEVVRLEL